MSELQNKTGRALGTIAEMACAACDGSIEVSFEQLTQAVAGHPPRCGECIKSGREPVADRGTYEAAVMPCRLCSTTRVLLPPAEARELVAKGRRPLCGVCFVNIEGPRMVAEAERNGNIRLAWLIRREIAETIARITAMMATPLGQKLSAEAHAAVVNETLKSKPAEA